MLRSGKLINERVFAYTLRTAVLTSNSLEMFVVDL